jgi:hypothetical protein
MLTTSDQIFDFYKPDMSKSKTTFEILGKKAFRWHLETQNNQIGSIFKFKIKKKVSNSKKNIAPCPLFHPLAISQKKLYLPHPPPAGNFSPFWNLTLFFYFEFKNTSNLIFLGFKVPSKSFFSQGF